MLINHGLRISDSLFSMPPFGKVFLIYAAILYLRIHGSLSAHLVLFEEASQFQQISIRNADRPAEMRSKASLSTTSVTLVIKDLSLPLES